MSAESGETPEQIEARIARTREELRLTVDELSDRLNPRNQAEHVLAEAKIAVGDLKRKVTGEPRPYGEPEPTRTGWVAVGAAALAGLAVVTSVVRRL